MAPPADEEKPKGRNLRALLMAVLLLACLVISLVVGLVVHFQLEEDEVPVINRTSVMADCSPELRLDVVRMRQDKDACQAKGCVYNRVEGSSAPWCHYPDSYGYRASGDVQETATGYQVTLTRSPEARAGQSAGFDDVILEVDMQTDKRVRVKMYPKDVERWEVPTEVLDIENRSQAGVTNSTAHYNVTFSHEPTFSVRVSRKSTGATIFDTSVPGLVMSEQFLQVTSHLATDRMYGLGEHRHMTLQHDMDWKLWSMFTHDAPLNSDWNLYSQHPVYMIMEEDGSANMVLLKNSNAMEVLLQPSPAPAVTWRTVGGVLDFYIFLGDSPSDVSRHYTQAIGVPVLPPYWSLGYHLSRWGYENITHLEQVIDRNTQAGIPYESIWTDIDVLFKSSMFTYDPENFPDLPKLVNTLRTQNRQFFTILDPVVAVNSSLIQEVQDQFPGYDMLESGNQADIWVKDAANDTLLGEVWAGPSAFPDFTNPASQSWWSRWINFYRALSAGGGTMDVRALWLDMSEPSSFTPGVCGKNQWNYPPYVPHVAGAEKDGSLLSKTLCMDAQLHWGRHYDVHSLYGHAMAKTTYRSLQTVFPGKRPWLMTRATFPGTGQFATKWQGDNRATWDNMHISIIHILEFGLFGIPMTGADICGFWLQTSFELCVRWHQLGAFYPFARNHNSKYVQWDRFVDTGPAPVLTEDQDPAAFGQQFVDLVKPAMMTRQKLLPYMYTLFYRAHVMGDTVARPLFFEFPEDEKTLTIDRQFMLGPALLISPILTQGATTVDAYVPQGRWFDYITGEEVQSSGQQLSLDTPLDKFNLHVRAGHVIPWQDPDVTTTASRTKGLGLIIALNESGTAQGELFWDDGESEVESGKHDHIRFEMKKAGELTISQVSTWTISPPSTLSFRTLEIYGLARAPSQVRVGTSFVTSDKISFFRNIVTISINQPMRASTTITWSEY